jgi:NADPH:quinone reductase-like Zn-dependent oxidoreductase
MKGVQLTGHGGPEKLVWNDAIPTPEPGPGEALVRVLAAGVNNTDINTRIGWYAKDQPEDAGDDAVSVRMLASSASTTGSMAAFAGADGPIRNPRDSRRRRW